MPGENSNASGTEIARIEAEIKNCRVRRRVIKGQITSVHTFLDTQQDNPDYEHIQARMDGLKEHFEEFKLVRMQLEEHESDNEEHEQNRQEMEANYYRAVGRARTLLKKLTGPVESQSENSSSSVLGNSNTQIIHTPIYKRLPELNPPKFDGQLENWAGFKSRFTSMISNNRHLQNSDKLQYLQSSLTGRAAKAIESLEITDANYDDAWQLLTEKYDNKRKAIIRHGNVLEDIEPLKNDNAEAIEELVDTVQQHLRSLKNLGQSIEHADWYIIVLLTRKIGSKLTREWEMTLPDNELPKYTSLIDFLSKRANCSDAKPTGSTRPAAAKGHSSNRSNGINRRGNAHQTFATDTRPYECPLCKEKHAIYQCPKFIELSIDGRIKAAQQAQLCLNCLRGQHKTKTCKSKGRCRTCEKQHHTMLHLIRDESTAQNSS